MPKHRLTRQSSPSQPPVSINTHGEGSEGAGQSGDTQGIRQDAMADSESIEELLEDGQTFEAEAVSGVENAPDPDEAEVTTHEEREEDVPPEDR